MDDSQIVLLSFFRMYLFITTIHVVVILSAIFRMLEE